MNFLTLVFLLWCLVLNSVLTCRVDDEYPQTVEKIQPFPDLYHSHRRNYYYEATPPTTTLRPEPSNRTIICSYIFDLTYMRYSYTEENFDQNLKIEDSNIPTLEQASFLTFTTIKKLFLDNINIQKILPGAFNGLTRIQELHLSNNGISEIQKGVYNSLHRLEILKLDGNKIHKIESMAFNGADNLVELYLQRNKIEEIEDGLLKTQKRLKYLDVSENPLVKISLDNLTSLDNLNLCSTLLKEFDSDFTNLTMKSIRINSSQLSSIDFSVFPELDQLDLSNNSVEILENCQNLDSTYINLSYNRIIFFNESFKGVSQLIMSHNSLNYLEDFLFKGSVGIRVIDFSYNQISTIGKYVFSSLRNLENLLLQNNNISKIDPVLFKDLINLKILNLSYNSLQEFQYGSFDSLTRLEILDISSNKLVSLHQYALSSLSNLNSLYFDNNNISSVSDFNKLFPHLRSLSLSNNPWKCQDLVKMSQTLYIYHGEDKGYIIRDGSSYDVENFHGIACKNEKEFPNDGEEESKLEKFFNGDFQKTKFFQYFDRDFLKSRFVKYWNNPNVVTAEYDINMERLVSVENGINGYENKILVFSAMVQVVIVVILLGGFCYMVGFLKKIHRPNFYF